MRFSAWDSLDLVLVVYSMRKFKWTHWFFSCFVIRFHRIYIVWDIFHQLLDPQMFRIFQVLLNRTSDHPENCIFFECKYWFFSGLGLLIWIFPFTIIHYERIYDYSYSMVFHCRCFLMFAYISARILGQFNIAKWDIPRGTQTEL